MERADRTSRAITSGQGILLATNKNLSEQQVNRSQGHGLGRDRVLDSGEVRATIDEGVQ